LNEIHVDLASVAFTLAASVLTGILFGFAPAFQFARSIFRTQFVKRVVVPGGSLRRSRFRQALIVSEVALSVVLLAGAGLLFRSFMRLQSVNTGFESRQVLTALVSPSGTNFKNNAGLRQFLSAGDRED
jgi:hypothetical protein